MQLQSCAYLLNNFSLGFLFQWHAHGNALAVKVCLKRSHQYYINILLKVKASSVFSKRVAYRCHHRRYALLHFFRVNCFSLFPHTAPLSKTSLSFVRYHSLSFYYTPECIQQCKTFIKSIIFRDVWAARWFSLRPPPPTTQYPSFTRGSDMSEIRPPSRQRCIKIITQTKNKNMIKKKNKIKTNEIRYLLTNWYTDSYWT